MSMKQKHIELDVDFIGGEGPLSEADEKGLSDFIREHKAKALEEAQAKKLQKPLRVGQALT